MTCFVAKTNESAGLYVSKLGAAGITQILLVAVNIPVVHKLVASEARLNISHQRRDLLSTCFLVFFCPLLFEVSALIPDQAFSKGLLDTFELYLLLFLVLEH